MNKGDLFKTVFAFAVGEFNAREVKQALAQRHLLEDMSAVPAPDLSRGEQGERDLDTQNWFEDVDWHRLNNLRVKITQKTVFGTYGKYPSNLMALVTIVIEYPTTWFTAQRERPQLRDLVWGRRSPFVLCNQVLSSMLGSNMLTGFLTV